ncbi:hypothetical protein FRC14_005608 [Serendipita sp. 396]|nr:hypothetical protein FRC14_005608 [Serendipita sp. 396]KAG8787269.1 hypothetical protein FRC15_009572 [Serendipita sp. 397]KAG8828043.1 hypothetical protein FRC19_009899 [Serendipita sp. 401]KAG8875455.1 hypothetical protein FRC20_003869 [Serendipita sp. 405]KAG9058347.1 hypothetical protein FS842_010073 [Serendipita sp. 407]
MFRLSTVLISTLSLLRLANGYDLLKTYAGDGFFNEWNFMDDWDHWTLGDIQYVPQSAAGNLTGVNPNSGGVIIRMDDFTTVAWDGKRNSIRLEGKQIFNSTNAVLVFDVLHVPIGCSVWGALWSKSAVSQWPEGGEVDIMEAVNKMPTNQMALHTDTACTVPRDNPGQTGTPNGNFLDCQIQRNADGTYSNTAGCAVLDSNPASYQDFASNQGGVWVTEYSAQAIKIWFFSRPNVPDALKSANSLDTTTLGTPTALFAQSATCDMAKALRPQHMVITLTACGSWAGLNDTIQATCGPLTTKSCYEQYLHDPNNYHDAYFEIASVKIFGDQTTLLENSTALVEGGNTPTGATPSQSGSTRSSNTRTTSATGTSTSTRNDAWALKLAALTPWSLVLGALTVFFAL